jgi:hypothetical protein
MGMQMMKMKRERRLYFGEEEQKGGCCYFETRKKRHVLISENKNDWLRAISPGMKIAF